MEVSKRNDSDEIDGFQSKRSRRDENLAVTKFEDLPNELCLVCIFGFFDLYSLYRAFYHLNTRYKQLVLSCPNLQLDLKNIPPSRFISIMHHIGSSFSSQSLVSLRSGTNAQIDLLSQDRLFTKLIRNVKSLTFPQDASLDAMLQLLRLESLQETLTYLNVKRISWKGCLANGCPSERCALDTHDEHGKIRTIFHIAFMQMVKLKTLRIAFREGKYPDEINFPSMFDDIQSSRRYLRDMKYSNLENLVINYISLDDCLYLREICPKLDYLEMRTDYEEDILGERATEQAIVPSVTNVCLLFDRWRDAKLKMNRIENLLSFFPNLSTLQVEQRATQITQGEWDDLAQTKAITIIDISCG